MFSSWLRTCIPSKQMSNCFAVLGRFLCTVFSYDIPMYTIKVPEFLQDHTPTPFRSPLDPPPDFPHAFCMTQRFQTLPYNYSLTEKLLFVALTCVLKR